jgi:uncharacterized membrane protein YqiK
MARRCVRSQAVIAALVLFGVGGCSILSRVRALESRPRVAVLAITGPAPAVERAKDEIRDALSWDYELVGRAQYDAAAKRLRARRLQPSHVAAVAAELELSAVLDGRVVRKGPHRYALSLRVREGVSGEVTHHLSLQLDRRERERERQKFGDELVATIGAMPAPFTLEDTPEPAPAPLEMEDPAAIAKAERAEAEKADAKRAEAERAEAERAEAERAKRAKAEAKRAAADAKRAEAEAKRAEAEAKRAEAERAKRAAADAKRAAADAKRAEAEAKRAEAEREEPDADEGSSWVEPRVDERGQVIDDEIPANLK